MENQTNQTTATLSDERLLDYMVVYKLNNNHTLLESLKCIEKHEVLTSLKEFCNVELKVCLDIFSSNLIFKVLLTYFESIESDRKSSKRRECLRYGGTDLTKCSMW